MSDHWTGGGGGARAAEGANRTSGGRGLKALVWNYARASLSLSLSPSAALRDTARKHSAGANDFHGTLLENFRPIVAISGAHKARKQLLRPPRMGAMIVAQSGERSLCARVGQAQLMALDRRLLARACLARSPATLSATVVASRATMCEL